MDIKSEEMEKDIMTIVDEDGTTEEVEVGNVTIYVSNVNRETGEPKLLGVEDENEWNRIKDVLRELAKDE